MEDARVVIFVLDHTCWNGRKMGGVLCQDSGSKAQVPLSGDRSLQERI